MADNNQLEGQEGHVMMTLRMTSGKQVLRTRGELK